MNSKVKELVKAARDYYAHPENGCGGSLHIVLDDGNVEEEHVLWCRDHAEEQGDVEGVALCDKLLDATEDERLRVYEHYKEYAR